MRSAVTVFLLLLASACGRTGLPGDPSEPDGLEPESLDPRAPTGGYSTARVGVGVGWQAGLLHVDVGLIEACPPDPRKTLHFVEAAMQPADAGADRLFSRYSAFGVVAPVACTITFDVLEPEVKAQGHWRCAADGGVEAGDFATTQWCDDACPLGVICG